MLIIPHTFLHFDIFIFYVILKVSVFVKDYSEDFHIITFIIVGGEFCFPFNRTHLFFEWHLSRFQNTLFIYISIKVFLDALKVLMFPNQIFLFVFFKVKCWHIQNSKQVSSNNGKLHLICSHHLLFLDEVL